MDAEQDSQQLTLNIRPEKPTYDVGEPVRLEVSVRNEGPTTVKTPRLFRLPADDPAKNNFDFEIHDGAGNRLARVSHTMTGRALVYPEIVSIQPGEDHRQVIQLAGTFSPERNGKRAKEALWNLGENPEVTHLNEYPPVTPGTFEVRLTYHVVDAHLVKLPEADRATVWKGRLTSNTTEIRIK